MCDRLLNTILGMDKSNDTHNARKHLADMKIRPELHLFTQGDKLIKLATEFMLPPEKHRKFCKFIKSVKFLDGYQ